LFHILTVVPVVDPLPAVWQMPRMGIVLRLLRLLHLGSAPPLVVPPVVPKCRSWPATKGAKLIVEKEEGKDEAVLASFGSKFGKKLKKWILFGFLLSMEEISKN
jgi:hypothetical protein